MELCCRVFHGARTRRETETPWKLKDFRTNRKNLKKHSKKKNFQNIIKHNHFCEFLEQIGEKEFFLVFYKCKNEVSDLQKKKQENQ